MRRRKERDGRVAALLFAVALATAGCVEGSLPPSPATAPPAGTTGEARSLPSPTGPRRALAIAIPAEPGDLTPVATDEATSRVNALIYNALYRLDHRFAPQPDLAAGPPRVSEDGLTWTVELRPAVTFHDGTMLGVDDVTFTYRLALSPHCPFGEERCEDVREQLRGVTSDGERTVRFALREPAAQFPATVLAQLAIVPERASLRAIERLLERARGIEPAALVGLSDRIAATTNADACLVDSPPPACSLAFYLPAIEEQLTGAGVALPERSRFKDIDGKLDADAYAESLLEDLRSLVAALTARDTDPAAAAYPLTDLGRSPVGTGPYVFRSYVPGQAVELTRNPAYFGGLVVPDGARVVIVPEPGAAATALQTGDVDWLPELAPDQVPVLAADPGLRVGSHARRAVLEIVFNVRPGRVYARRSARRAFAGCIDRDAIVREASGGRGIVAHSPIHPDSWAYSSVEVARRDPGRVRRALEDAGWRLGADGVYARDGQRLSSQLFVRHSRGDELALALSASEQLRECGIELRVEELDVAGEALLSQIAYPNEFETVLRTRELGVDPGTDLSVYDSARITTESNPGDANFGGWDSRETDRLLERGRLEVDQVRRRDIYGELQQLIARELPVYPLWYEVGHSGLSRRVRSERGIDLRRLRHDWAIDTWRLEGRGSRPGG